MEIGSLAFLINKEKYFKINACYFTFYWQIYSREFTKS